MKFNLWKIGTVALGGVLLIGLGFYFARTFTNNSDSKNKPNPILGFLSNNTIPIKAALVYKMGGAQPISRTKFYLLKEDLKVIAQKSGKKDSDLYTTPYQASMMALAIEMVNSGKMDKPELKGAKPPSIGIDEDSVKDYAVQSVTTDFEGNAKFENVPSGTYYIVGFATTRKEAEYVVWSVKVNTEQTKDTVLLDQENAYKVASF